MPTYNFFDHPRFRHLCQLLHDVATPEAIMGHITRLEAFMAASKMPRLSGDLTDMSDQSIEHAANWFSHPGRFVEAMQKTELIYETEGQTRQFRGWPKIAPKYVVNKINASKGTPTPEQPNANPEQNKGGRKRTGANASERERIEANRERTIQSRERVEINSPPTPPAGGDAAGTAGGGGDPPEQIEQALRRAGLRSGSKICRLIEQSPWLTPDGIDRVARAVKAGGGRAGLIAETLADEKAYQAAIQAAGEAWDYNRHSEAIDARQTARMAEDEKTRRTNTAFSELVRRAWSQLKRLERDRILAAAQSRAHIQRLWTPIDPDSDPSEWPVYSGSYVHDELRDRNLIPAYAQTKKAVEEIIEDSNRRFRLLWEGVPESERDRILAVAGEQYERGECIVRGEPLKPRTVRQMPFSVRGSPDEWTNIAKWIVESVIKTEQETRSE